MHSLSIQHYFEPYNLVFCHLLRSGSLHDLCERGPSGRFTRQTMLNLLVVASHMFGRMKLNIGYYEYNKKKFHNSKVKLVILFFFVFININ